MNFIPCIELINTNSRSREYSRFELTLVKLHISRCKILNGDSSIVRVMQDVSCAWLTCPYMCHNHCPVWIPGIVHRTTLTPIYISQSQSTLYNANLWLFTFWLSHQITTLLWQWWGWYWVRKYNEIQFVLIMLLFITNMT